MFRWLGCIIAAIMAANSATAPAATVAFTGQFSNDTPTPMPSSGCASGQIFVSFNPGNSTAAGTSNFGSFGPSQSHCLTPGQPYNGVFSFDFAAGDMFSGTTSGYMTPTGTANVFNSYVTYTLTGGTGRFAAATGTIEGTGLLDRRPARPLNKLTLEGTLNLSAVPEPSTWATMIIGLGAVGGTMRRRNRRFHREDRRGGHAVRVCRPLGTEAGA